MLDEKKCALGDIEPFGLKEYPAPIVEKKSEEPAIAEDT
jgi:hypothetical protein